MAEPSTQPALTREQVAARIAGTSVLHGTFTLRSGRTSQYYLDKYRFCTEPDVLRALGAMFAERLPAGTTRLAGAELGGVPLVTAASMASDIPCLFIRNQRKGYGTANQLEGALEPGDRVVILEDVATTGGQVLEAARVIVAEGATVLRIIATIDRGEGAAEHIREAGFEFESLFTVEDLGVSG